MPKAYKVNAVSDDGLRTILQHVLANKIDELDLSNSYLTAKGAMILRLFMTAYPQQLTKLDLSNNPLGDRGVEELSRCINRPKNRLQHLALNNCNVGLKSAKLLGAALCSNKSLRLLQLANNDLFAKGAAFLVCYLFKNNTLQTLDISGNDIGNEGIARMAPHLQRNKTLKHLILADNQITDAGTNYLRRLNCRTLDLSYNHISEGIHWLLPYAYGIKVFNLDHNLISGSHTNPKQFADLKELLKENSNLTVTMRHNSFTQDELVELHHLKLANLSLDKLPSPTPQAEIDKFHAELIEERKKAELNLQRQKEEKSDTHRGRLFSPRMVQQAQPVSIEKETLSSSLPSP